MGKINLKLGNIKDYRVRSTTLDFRLSLRRDDDIRQCKICRVSLDLFTFLPYNKKENGSS